MSEEGDYGYAIERRDRTKRYRSDLDGTGFKIIILSEHMIDLPTRALLKGRFADFREDISEFFPPSDASTDAKSCKDCGHYSRPSDRQEFLDRAQEAFSRVWPTFSLAQPQESVVYVTRSARPGLFYIVLEGATIAYNRSNAKYQVHSQVERGWIGDGSTYTNPNINRPLSNETRIVAEGFERFLGEAGISMGDFVEDMLDAIENPLCGGIAQTFEEHGLRVIHARYTAFVGAMNTVVLNVGTVRLTIEFGDTGCAVPVCCINHQMPWMTDAVLANTKFWRTLALRVLGKVPNVDRSGRVVSWRPMNGSLDLESRTVADLSPAFDMYDESVPASQEF